MFRQSYQARTGQSTTGPTIQEKLKLKTICREAANKYDRTETSFAGNCTVTQKDLEKFMKLAEETAKK